ncbi:MAG: sulfatase-like hydrolase/transferase [Bacteroidales bacterium]
MKKSVLKKIFIPVILIVLPAAQVPPDIRKDPPAFENPVTVRWIRENIAKTTPRLILTPPLERKMREKLEKDPLAGNGYRLLERGARSILEKETLTYRKTGRRLLGVSREALLRLSTLALVYRMEMDERYLQRLEQELEAVCSFGDWNPSHFLDAAEMAAGVALALDWCGEWISSPVDRMARTALVEKALKPGLAGADHNFWVDAHHNWNLVCHGGLSLAALTVFEQEPELSARILHRAVDKIPLGLEPYAPDGVYPEGPSYWFYATKYLTAAISAFQSALGTDFGFTGAPGLKESALFSQVLAGPSGQYYNYFDAGLGGYHSLSHFGLLSWFAGNTGTGMDREAYGELLRREAEQPGQPEYDRFFSLFWIWLASAEQAERGPFIFPEVWTGRGEEPIGIFREPEGGGDAFFMAAKGGRAADNHGNMDAGSFILELNGVRWSVDPGNQNYHELEQILGNELWDQSRDSRRWSLLTKNNFGHSTLTVNGEMHVADARATMVRTEEDGEVPRVTFDLSPVYGNSLEQAHRTFSKLSGHTLQVSDRLVFNENTRTITWQLITRAEAEVEDGRIILRQEGERLQVSVRPSPAEVDVVSLSPPPLPCDKEIPGLKRLELKFERISFPGPSGEIEVELSAIPRERPNFVWIVSEDNSKHYMKLFDPHGIRTPRIEEMAREGILFTRTFSNSPVCSVARSTLISSCYGPRTGAQFHRKSLMVPMPEGIDMFPTYLRRTGYYTTNNHKEDYNYRKNQGVWDESSVTAHWENRGPGQPFFHMESHPVSHESRLHFEKQLMERYRPVTDPDSVFVFPVHPDTELFRFTGAYYRDKILSVDTIVGRVLGQLKKEGLLESTFVFYFSDHGGVLPGSKGYLYETGLHVPLVVRIPEKFKHLVEQERGSTCSGFVSFVDFGPTLLELAGAQIPEGIDGKPFLGRGITPGDPEEGRFGYADRFDEKYDLVRSLRKGKFKYIRNYQPFYPDGLYNEYRYRCLAYRQWREMFRNGELNGVQRGFFEPRKAEVLYDLEKDPFETRNLAGDPAYRAILMELRNSMTKWIKEMPDLSFYPESKLYHEAFREPVKFGQDHRQEIAELVDVANLGLLSYDEARTGIASALEAAEVWKKYWGLIVCSSFGKKAAEFTDKAEELTTHPNFLVRTRAAEFLGITGDHRAVEVITGCLEETEDPIEALLMLNTVVFLMDGPMQFTFGITEKDLHPEVRKNEWVKSRMEYIGIP